ncbi:hypothetical protein [Thiohalospira halophila]|uniref:hypothetical protein n=1 Tax=Thiohalospira halophila TaxID=381300 RepID=UPI00117E4D3A|nr:hypothetical protein [Thiohalospira halophila]
MSANELTVEIDLKNHGGPVFAGRERGKKVREAVKLEDIDRDESKKVKVVIPDDTYSINSSFFLGLFGDSIRHAGSKDSFLRKFEFYAPGHFRPKIESYISRALFERRGLL